MQSRNVISVLIAQSITLLWWPHVHVQHTRDNFGDVDGESCHPLGGSKHHLSTAVSLYGVGTKEVYAKSAREHR